MKRAFTLIELLVVLAIIGVLAALLFPVVCRSPSNGNRSACQSNLKQIGLAMLQYAQDYHERFPSLAFNDVSSSTTPFAKPYGWADGVQPYLRSTQVFQCPSERETLPAADATQNGFVDYWMNSNLARVQMKNVPNPTQTLLAGEGNDARDGSDARYNRNVLPQGWKDDEKSPANRHLDTGNYLFADGHVKALKPNRIQTHFSETAPTFALR